MLTIEEIKKALDTGEVVELECNVRGKALNELYFSELEKLEVGYVNINENGLRDGVYIKDGSGHVRNSSYFMPKEELKYFRIKRPAPTFDDLIDVATKAFKDGVLFSVVLVDGRIDFRLEFNDSPTTIYDDSNSNFGDHINNINSLYTETFVIESEEDIERVTQGAKITLTNDSVFTATLVTQLSRGWVVDSVLGNLNQTYCLFLLKGATITQKRGAL